MHQSWNKSLVFDRHQRTIEISSTSWISGKKMEMLVLLQDRQHHLCLMQSLLLQSIPPAPLSLGLCLLLYSLSLEHLSCLPLILNYGGGPLLPNVGKFCPLGVPGHRVLY